VDGKPIQVIEPYLNLDIPLLDLRELSEAEREIEAHRCISEKLRPLNLAKAPLMRFTLIRMDEEDHILVISCITLFSMGGQRILIPGIDSL
jgi:hypothetical protein